MRSISTLTHDSPALGFVFRIRSVVCGDLVWTVILITNSLRNAGLPSWSTFANFAFKTGPNLSTNTYSIANLNGGDLGANLDCFSDDFVSGVVVSAFMVLRLEDKMYIY